MFERVPNTTRCCRKCMLFSETTHPGAGALPENAGGVAFDLDVAEVTEMTVKQAMLVIYLVPTLLIWLVYYRNKLSTSAVNRAFHDDAVEAGLVEPVSLHPVINPNRCIGCASCVFACPENRKEPVLGIINSKSVLINPTQCIGHGACKKACPTDAISLVFGTETRGVEIPNLNPDFETNVEGIFIAGELGGMGLIRNAVVQGRQAMDSVKAKLKKSTNGATGVLDCVVVGAGPAGLSASLTAKALGMKIVTLEQDSLGGAVFKYPRQKIVMTQPVDLPLVGKVRLKETSKEALLELWEGIVAKTDLKISFRERVLEVRRGAYGFTVETNKSTYETQTVLLCTGRRGTPRRLGIPGEDHSKVVYHLVDPNQYRNRRVVVIGGGDSALEAATSIAEIPGTSVVLSYRGAQFNRARKKNREKLEYQESQGIIEVMRNSNVEEISQTQVGINAMGKRLELDNDAVIVCAGGVMPGGFLKSMGIEVETKYGTL